MTARGRAPGGSRDRMVTSAAFLIASRGLRATSFSDVLASSRAPRGSIYYHFPRGKRQLAREAVGWIVGQVLAHQRGCTASTPSGVLEHFVKFFRRSLLTSHCRTGCPVTGVAVDASANEDDLLAVARAGFQSWIALLTQQLAAAGIPRREAREVSVITVASVEGALVLCRAEGTVGPLNIVAKRLRSLVKQ